MSVSPGERYGRLTVKEFAGAGRSTDNYLTICDCGNSRIVDAPNLKSGRVDSCGCLGRERHLAAVRTHGYTKTRTYRVWYGLKQRCNNPNAPNYRNYGARGITVCERWQTFENFLSDMCECPPGLTIERIDNNGNYGPENCRWATEIEQHRNTRRNINVTVNGVSRCVAEWACVSGIPRHTIHYRLKKGWSPERAIGQPSRAKRANGTGSARGARKQHGRQVHN